MATQTEIDSPRDALALSSKELIRKNANINVLKKQLQNLLNAIENNPHCCGHQLIAEMKSSEKLIETMV